ncbi:MAG: hypothetical protein GC136_07640 [Alphaproteobacteria bacterium]|nr:hypothetical protein [Alphaproteobacteria bacterium]
MATTNTASAEEIFQSATGNVFHVNSNYGGNGAIELDLAPGQTFIYDPRLIKKPLSRERGETSDVDFGYSGTQKEGWRGSLISKFKTMASYAIPFAGYAFNRRAQAGASRNLSKFTNHSKTARLKVTLRPREGVSLRAVDLNNHKRKGENIGRLISIKGAFAGGEHVNGLTPYIAPKHLWHSAPVTMWGMSFTKSPVGEKKMVVESSGVVLLGVNSNSALDRDDSTHVDYNGPGVVAYTDDLKVRPSRGNWNLFNFFFRRDELRGIDLKFQSRNAEQPGAVFTITPK